MASISSPCVACKFLRRKCSSDCIFAPYFAPDQTQKFINLHKAYGTSNVQKLLAELPVDQRQNAVNSLAYEAEARLQDPVYGCVGPIVFLQHRVKNLKGELQDAYKELAACQDAVLQTQQAMGVAGLPATQPTPEMMHPLGVNPLSASSSSEPYKMASMMGIPTRGSSLEIREPGPQSNNNNTTFHPEQLFMPTATVGREEQQDIIRGFELHQHEQDIRFDMGRGFNVGAGSSTGVGVVGFSRNDPGPQSNNNNTTLHPEQLVMPIATVETEQQEIIRDFELQQHEQDFMFDRGQGFDLGEESSNGVGVVGFSLNDPGPQSNNNNNTLHPEQLVMPIATVGTEQQEIIRDFELQQHEQDFMFDWGQGFDVGTGSSSGVGVVGFSLDHPDRQSNNNNSTLYPEQLVMPVATVGLEQQQIIRDFELQQHEQDIRFDRGQGFDVGEASSNGVGVVGFSLNDPGPQSNSNNNTLHPEQLVMPIATVGTERQEIIRDFELQQHEQDFMFNWGQGFDVGTGSSSGVGVGGFSLNHPGRQSNTNNSTLHPEQLVMPIGTVGTEQQEIIRAFELQQHGQDIRFDMGRGFNVGVGSSTGVGVEGFSLSDPGPQSNNNNTLHPEQPVMPIATIGTEQLQEIIRDFELQQHGQDISFDMGQGFNVGAGNSTGVVVEGFSLNDPGRKSNNNTLHPEQPVTPFDTIGTEQLQEIIRDFDLQPHRQDISFDMGLGFNVGAGSSTEVGVEGFSPSDPGPQSNNNTLHPKQLDMPIATFGMEQREIIRAFELQQHGQDISFEMGRGFNVGAGSRTEVGVEGFSLSDPGPQSNNNTLHPEQPVTPFDTIGTEQLQEIITAFDLQPHRQDISFDMGLGFNVGAGSSTEVGVEGFSLSDPGPQSNNNTLHPKQPITPIDTMGTEQLQEIIRAFELQPHGQDISFDLGRGLNVGAGNSTGVGVEGFSLNDPGPQSNNNNNTLHPEQLVMPIATVGTEGQKVIRAFELQQHRQDIMFNKGQGFDVGTGSSSGIGVVGFSLNNPGPQSNNNNKTLHPEQLIMPIVTVGSEQQETIRAFELQQQVQDIRFNGGRGFNVWAGSSTGGGVEGFSLNDSSPQSNNSNNTLHPELLVMPIATVGTEQEEVIRAFELQQHGQHIMFDRGQGFDVGTGSSSGVGVVGFSLNNPGPQSNNNNKTLHPEQLVLPIATVGSEQQETIRAFELPQHGQDIRFDGGRGFNVGTGSSTGVGVLMGSFESGLSHSHYQPQPSLQPQQVVAVQEHHTQELESQSEEEWLHGLIVGNGESDTGSSFYYVNR